MKLALLMALAADKRSGAPLGDALPYDQALAEFKRCTTGGVAPHHEFPILEVWSGGSPSKTFRFRAVSAENGTLLESGSPDELNALLAANERMQAEIEEAKKHFQPMLDELEKTRSANLDLKGQLEAGKVLADGFNQRLAALESDLQNAISRATTDKAAADAAISRVSELEAQLAEVAKKKK